MKLLSIVTATALLAAGSAQANWALVKDFEGSSRAENFSNIWFDLHVPMDPEYGGYSPLVTFPEDPARPGNHVFNDYPVGAGLSIGYLENFVFIDLKANSIPGGAKGTLFWQFYRTGQENDSMTVGLTAFDVNQGDPATRPDGWGDGSPDLPLGDKQDMNWRKYSGTLSYEAGAFDARGYAFDPTMFPPNEWTSVWLVADTQNNTYQLYISNSTTGNQVSGPITGYQEQEDGTFLPGDTFNFRNTDVYGQAMQSVFIGTNAGDPEAPLVPWNDVYLDNFYVDASGQNTTDPMASSGEMWADWPVQPDGWVVTGNFLGTIYPMGDWVWSANLSAWIYLPEAWVQSGGTWAYVLR